MPLYDRKCPNCGDTKINCWEPMDSPPVICSCGARTERAWITNASSVIGDELDIEITNGLCNIDGTPRRYRSREEMNKEAKKRGFTQYVVHTDDDHFVKSMAIGLPPGVDGRPMSMLSPEEQEQRRREWLEA